MNDIEKIPPQSVQIEEMILGAILIDQSSIDKVPNLRPFHFYKLSHQTIFEAIYNLHSENKRFDMVVVCNQLSMDGKMDEAGGASYITGLTTRVASSYNIEEHHLFVIESYIKRELIRISSSIMEMSYNNDDPQDIIDYGNISIDKITHELMRFDDVKSIKDLITESLRQYDERTIKYSEGDVTGINTPIAQLTRYVNGWQNGELIIIAGRPAMGKTAFVIACAKAAARKNKSTVIFSLEMKDISLSNRMIVGESNIDADNFKKGCLTENENVQLMQGVDKLNNYRIYVDDKPGSTMAYIKSRSRILKKNGQCDMIIIDYLQLVGSNKNKNKNREQEVSEISRECKILAKELDVPVIGIAQLSRAVEGRAGEKRPQLSDLRESGAIEQDADMVCFLYRPEYYGIIEDEYGNSTKGKGELIIAKYREGWVGTVPFRYNESLTQIFDNVSSDFEIRNFIEPNDKF